MDSDLEARIDVIAGYDRRPAPEGIHGAEIIFALRGAQGAVTFSVYTNWLPLETQRQLTNISRTTPIQPVPLDFVFHSPIATENTGKDPRIGCAYVTGGVCYHTISKNTAVFLRDVLLAEGDDGVWREMGVRYRSAVNQIGSSRL